MKNKFLILSLLVCSFFTACSSDDDGGNNNDPIVGTWYLTSDSSDDDESDIDDCSLQSHYVFNSDNTSQDNYYYSDGECILDQGTGTWAKEGENTYSAYYEYEEGNDTYEFELSD